MLQAESEDSRRSSYPVVPGKPATSLAKYATIPRGWIGNRRARHSKSSGPPTNRIWGQLDVLKGTGCWFPEKLLWGSLLL